MTLEHAMMCAQRTMEKFGYVVIRCLPSSPFCPTPGEVIPEGLVTFGRTSDTPLVPVKLLCIGITDASDFERQAAFAEDFFGVVMSRIFPSHPDAKYFKVIAE